jgi:hypothetical protein
MWWKIVSIAISIVPSLELGALDVGLPDDGHQRTGFEFLVIWNRHGDGASRYLLLHDNMTAFSSHFMKAMSLKNLADLLA